MISDITGISFIEASCQKHLITIFGCLKIFPSPIPSKNPQLKLVKISFLIVDFKVLTQIWSFRVGDTQFDLYMKMDTNTNGHRQWFYFSVKNLTKTTIKFNIYRFKKRYSLFQRGMRPYIRSKKGKNQWFPGGTKVYYKKQKQSNQYGVHKDKKTYYLTFQYKFEHEDDEVFFAAGIPYTYTFLNKQIQLYKSESKPEKIKFETSTICKSMCGLPIPLISIEPINQSSKVKNFIIINARTHAGETSCSWVLDGLLEKICSSDKICKWIEKNNIYFRIIPMLNVDGVFVGNYRTGIIGDDFNRKFLSGKKEFFPQIFALKKLVLECKKNGAIHLFLDLHGHSILKNSFIYGPIQQLFQQFPLKHLPFSLDNKSKYFRLASCKFKFEKDLNQTARVYFQIKDSILSFTCQNSLGLYYNENQTFQMQEQDYKLFGKQIMDSICQLLDIENSNAKFQKISEQEKNKITQKMATTYQELNKIKVIKNQLQSNRLSESPKKQFPSLERIRRNVPRKEQKNKEQPSTKRKSEKIQSKKQFISKRNTTQKMNNTVIAKEKRNQRQGQSSADKKIKDLFNQQLLQRNFIQTGGIFPKKVSQFQGKIYDPKQTKFKIRRKSDAMKLVPDSLRKKVGQKNTKKKFSSSKYINENEENCSLERSVTFDSAYLSTYIDKQEENEEQQNNEGSQNSLSIVKQNFSEDYESMNDQDSDSDDLLEHEKNYILEFIRNNRKLRTTQNEESDISQPQQEIRENPQNITNINGFKEIRFRSIEHKNDCKIPSLKPTKRQPHRFRQFTHKSLGKEWREEEGIIHIIQKKKLNERAYPKRTRDPYFLIQIKNKHL